MSDHVTHVERHGACADSFYFWCESEDCYARGHHYHTETEATEAAAEHERIPG